MPPTNPLETLRREMYSAAQKLRQFGRLTASRLLGTVAATNGAYLAIVDMEERSLFTRAEMNALTKLVAQRLGIGDAELLATIVEEYRHLLAEKGQQWPELEATEAGIVVKNPQAFAAHLCHAKACTVPVPPAMLMCRRHWFMVPAPLRRAVWATYVRGQEIRKDPSPEYLRAANAAIDAVAQKEGR